MKIESITISKEDLKRLETEKHVNDVYCTVQIEGRKNTSKYRISKEIGNYFFVENRFFAFKVTKDQLIII